MAGVDSGVETGVGQRHCGGGGVGVDGDRVLGLGVLGMVSILVNAERVLGVERLAALVAGPGHVNVKLHVTSHVAQVVRLTAADRASPHQLVGVLLPVLDDQVGDLLVEVHDRGVRGGDSGELAQVG